MKESFIGAGLHLLIRKAANKSMKKLLIIDLFYCLPSQFQMSTHRQVNLQVTSNGYGKHSTSKTQDKKIHACPEMCMKPEMPAECWQKIPAGQMSIRGENT